MAAGGASAEGRAFRSSVSFLRFRQAQRRATSKLCAIAVRSSMITAKPLARYSAIGGALPSGFATAELHHLLGPDLPLDKRR
jgi:hypothetical protein